MERLRPVFTGAGWDLLCLTTLLKAFNCLGWSGLAIKSTPQETSWFSLPCKALHCSLGSFVRSWIIFAHKECIWGLLYSAFKVGGAGSHNTILQMRKVGGGGGRTTATTCTEMPSLLFSTAGIRLHDCGESKLQGTLSSASMDQDHKPKRKSHQTLPTDLMLNEDSICIWLTSHACKPSLNCKKLQSSIWLWKV